MTSALHSRWTPMRPHPVQQAFFESVHRFNVVPAGRRSGKTEIAKRRLVKRAVIGSNYDRPRFFAAAPTRDQAKRIFWADLKRMVPKAAMRGRPSESELVIPLWHGGEIFVFGLDKPERIEGAPVDGGVLDEYGNIKPQSWGENVRPALSDRRGWCDLIGVPEGRNHYFEASEKAKAELLEHGQASEWGYFHWISADILPADEIAAAKRDLDELTYCQEYEASFVNFEGRAYYAFTDENKARLRELHDYRQPIVIALDFNVAPGVAAICQELPLPRGGVGTAVIGEVWIENNSSTPAVCRKLLADWKDYTNPLIRNELASKGFGPGIVHVYGDATGGARGTAKVDGSDWDLVKKILQNGDPSHGLRGFERVMFHDQRSNPAERARVNAVNTRCRSMDGTIRLMVDPIAAPHVVRDLEGVRTLAGGSGELDKKIDPKLTHISDALGYYIAEAFPIGGKPEWGHSTWRRGAGPRR